MKKYVHLTLVLFIIAFLSGFVLGVVNDMTKGPIAKATARKLANGIEEIFPNLDKEKLDDAENTVAINDNYLLEYYIIYSKSGEVIGYVFKVNAPNPYKAIQFIVGIDIDGEVKGISYLSIEETPGLGTKVKTADFIKSFIGKTEVDDVKIISGATKSSNGVKNGVKLALDYFNENLAGGAANEN